MQDEEVIEDLGVLAAQFSLDTSHIDINQVYDSFCTIIDGQLENPKGSQNFHKAWWNEELSTLAKMVKCALKAWEGIRKLKLAYLNLQRNFSKLMRKCKRQFRRERQMNLLEQQKNKPKNFIKGIRWKSHELPMSLQTADGTVVKETGEVLEAWKDYFCKLLNPSSGNGYRQSNVHPIDSLHLDASELNDIISFEKVRRAVLQMRIPNLQVLIKLNPPS